MFIARLRRKTQIRRRKGERETLAEDAVRFQVRFEHPLCRNSVQNWRRTTDTAVLVYTANAKKFCRSLSATTVCCRAGPMRAVHVRNG